VDGPMPIRSGGDDIGGGGRATMNRAVIITNPLGLHMRAAKKFVETAGRFRSAVTVRWDDRQVNGKSIWDLMPLGAPEGTRLILEVSGDDAAQALPVLAEVLGAPSADDVDDQPNGTP
jgi:phosphocarrier protein HPr